MKKTVLIILLAMVLCQNVPAYALPMLQLDISNSVYNAYDETVFAQDKVFDLYALLSSKTFDSENFYISVAVRKVLADAGSDIGTFVFGSQTLGTSDLSYGDPQGLQTHGIFPSYYWEQQFNFVQTNKASNYNVQDSPGAFTINSKGGLYYSTFRIDTSNLGYGYALHFDLYSKDADKFAPFSHDAQSLVSLKNNNNTVSDPAASPEPATLLLLGIGLLGIAGLGRKAGKSN